MAQIAFKIPIDKKDIDYIGFDPETQNSIFVFPCQYFSNYNGKTITIKDVTKNEYESLKREAKKILDIITESQFELQEGESRKGYLLYQAFLWILRDYLKNGYFKETQIETKPFSVGKINWKKTVKTNNMLFDKDDFIFRYLYKFRRKIDENQIITEIYKCCLAYAVENLGWYYDLYHVDHSIFSIQNKEARAFMITFLKQRLSNSFLDYKKQVIHCLLDILQERESGQTTKYFCASEKEFEYVFEKIVLKTLGTENVKDFYSHASYFLNQKQVRASNLRPDTILSDKRTEKEKTVDYLVVIDSKHYNFGYGNRSVKDLPQSADVVKQIGYAEYIINNKLQRDDGKIWKVKSAFLLPYSKSHQTDDIDDDTFEYVGYATDNNGGETKRAENIFLDKKVYVFLVDLKTIIDVYYNNDKVKKRQLQAKFLDAIIKCI